MSATNKTTNIELPLFIGTDIPSWLGDWNGAMTTIDSQIATAKSDAQGAAATADAASESAAQTAQGLVAANNNISSLQTTVSKIQGVSNTSAQPYTQNVNSCECVLYYTNNTEFITVLIAYNRKANATSYIQIGSYYLFPLAYFSGTPLNIGGGDFLTAGFNPDFNSSGDGSLTVNFQARIGVTENGGNTYVGIILSTQSITNAGSGSGKFAIIKSGSFF